MTEVDGVTSFLRRGYGRARRLWSSIRWSLFGTDEIRLQEGPRLRLSRASEFARIVRRRERFEAAEREFTIRFLRSGDVYVDAGANIGLFTVIGAGLVGPAGKVFAFEPTPSTFRLLQCNLRLNECANVVALQAGLSSTDGEEVLEVSTNGRDAWNSFAPAAVGGEAVHLDVPVLSWDSFAEANDLLGEVRLMKIDVEGWEKRVLLGGSKAFARPDAPVLQVEFTAENARASGGSCRELAAVIRGFGYDLFRYSHRDNVLVEELADEEFRYLNLYAVKDLSEVVRRVGCEVELADRDRG